jgi:glycosyltransferase involved in cell wall biosynthesis
VEPPEVVAPDVIGLDHVGAVVVPASALGGIPALAADYSGIPLIAVRENHTILDVTADALGLENVIQVESYLEAAGVLLALRRGISLESLRRPIARPASVEDP